FDPTGGPHLRLELTDHINHLQLQWHQPFPATRSVQFVQTHPADHQKGKNHAISFQCANLLYVKISSFHLYSRFTQSNICSHFIILDQLKERRCDKVEHFVTPSACKLDFFFDLTNHLQFLIRWNQHCFDLCIFWRNYSFLICLI